jgi:hypothetical protein
MKRRPSLGIGERLSHGNFRIIPQLDPNLVSSSPVILKGDVYQDLNAGGMAWGNTLRQAQGRDQDY